MVLICLKKSLINFHHILLIVNFKPLWILLSDKLIIVKEDIFKRYYFESIYFYEKILRILQP